jgi:thiamine pyrophosphokinase
MDSLPDPETRLAPYPPETVFRYPAAKDFTDAELALSLLWDRGGGEIWLAGGGGGRTDHLLGIRSLFERDRSPARWITAAEDIRCVEGGGPLPAELTFPGGGSPAEPGPARVSVFPLGAGPWEAESEGLRWPLGGLPWDRGFFGLSNEAPLGSFTIRAVRGRFLAVIAVEGGAVTALGFT